MPHPKTGKCYKKCGKSYQTRVLTRRGNREEFRCEGDSPMTPRKKWLKEANQRKVSGPTLEVGKFYYIIVPVRNYRRIENSKPYHIFATGKCEEVKVNRASNNDTPYYARFTHFKVLKSNEPWFRLQKKVEEGGQEFAIHNARYYVPPGNISIVYNVFDKGSVDDCYPNCSFYFPQNRNIIFAKVNPNIQKMIDADTKVYHTALLRAIRLGAVGVETAMTGKQLTNEQIKMSNSVINKETANHLVLSHVGRITRGGKSRKMKMKMKKGKKTKSKK